MLWCIKTNAGLLFIGPQFQLSRPIQTVLVCRLMRQNVFANSINCWRKLSLFSIKSQFDFNLWFIRFAYTLVEMPVRDDGRPSHPVTQNLRECRADIDTLSAEINRLPRQNMSDSDRQRFERIRTKIDDCLQSLNNIEIAASSMILNDEARARRRR